jgi:hypothetical protein
LLPKKRRERKNTNGSPGPEHTYLLSLLRGSVSDAHPDLTEDFVRRVLNLDWAWISDESSLWDFHASDDNGALIARINEVYGVDVSDIESAKLCEILERIAANQPS